MARLLTFETGDVIIRENDRGETLYVLDEGLVEVTKALEGRVIQLGFIGQGEIFGEMSLIDEKPRSATVTAVERTVVRELHRKEFVHDLKTQPDVALAVLRILFERLRQAHGKILHLHAALAAARETQASRLPAKTPGKKIPDIEEILSVFPAAGSRQRWMASLEGVNGRAQKALPHHPYLIRKFPFYIGRKSEDPLVYNDLYLSDSKPFQVSRHHVELFVENARLGALDRGSYLGSYVNGKKIGGEDGATGPVFFDGESGILILGEKEAGYPFKILVQPAL